jgi:hypothetical protein
VRQIVKTAFWDGLRLWAAAMLFFLAMMFGCAAPKTAGWHPESEQEMKVLIGQTVMEAIHQYRMQLWKGGVQVPDTGSHMNKETSPAPKLPLGPGDEDNRV